MRWALKVSGEAVSRGLNFLILYPPWRLALASGDYQVCVEIKPWPLQFSVRSLGSWRQPRTGCKMRSQFTGLPMEKSYKIMHPASTDSETLSVCFFLFLKQLFFTHCCYILTDNTKVWQAKLQKANHHPRAELNGEWQGISRSE